MVDVCQFIYRYTDSLPGEFNQYERDQVREAMLDDYRQWNERIANRMIAIKRKSDDEK